MATAPFYVADLATLKARLRLTGTKAAEDSSAMIDEAILTVRLGFIRHLGMTRVLAIKAMAFSEAPSSADEITRAVANVTEVDWVRYELMRTLPTMFQDASGAAMELFNREAPFRRTGQSDLERRRSELYDTILQNLEMLAGNEELGEDGVVQGGAIERSTPAPRPFDSIFPNGLVASTRVF